MESGHKSHNRILLLPGTVLILAGAFKFHSALIAHTPDDLSSTMTLIFGELEILFGLWLTTGISRERARSWTIAIFGGLWVTNVYKISAGHCSCDCFGVFSINPWVVLLLDSMILFVLLRWHLSENSFEVTSNSFLEIIGMSIALIAVVLIGVHHQSLSVITGTAKRGGQALVDTRIDFRGGHVEFSIVTDRDGFFRSPPVRPGQYSLSIDTPSVPRETKVDTPNQVFISGQLDKLGRPSLSGLRNKVSPEARKRVAALAQRYDKIGVVSLIVDGCTNNNVIANFD